MKILIIIALYLLVFFEIWDRTVNVRKKFWYVFKKLFRPIIPIVERGAYIPDSLRDKEYIVIDRTQPKLSYENAAKYINSLKIQKDKRRCKL